MRTTRLFQVGRWLGVPAAIVAFAVFLVAGLWVGVVVDIAHDKEIQERFNETVALNLARTFEEHVRRAVTIIDQAILYLRDGMEGGRDFDRQVALMQRGVPDGVAFQVAIIGADGMLRYSSLSGSGLPIDLSDREHYTVHRESGADRLFISKPVNGRVSQRWSVQFTRRLGRPDGGFDGVLVVSTDPAYFSSLYQTVDIGPNGTVELVGADGVIRSSAARRPEAAGTVGAVSANDYFAAGLPAAGLRRVACRADPEKQIIAYRRLDDLGLAVAVRLCLDDFMQSHHAHASNLRAFGMTVSALLLGASIAIAWLMARRQRDGIALAVQARRLQQSNSELEAFAYAISHDLREPLRTINSFLTLLVRRAAAKLTSEESEFIDFARSAAVRMDSLINGLLDFSRVGRRDTPFSPVRLDAVVDMALANLRGTIDACEASISIAPGLPEVLGQGDELLSLFQNLIANALKYRVPDHRPVISVTWRREGGEWIIAVADNGIGMAAEHHERIFGIFQRLHARDAYDGAGVGLALCRKIVEHHHGRIWLTSAEGEGSTFFVAFPAME